MSTEPGSIELASLREAPGWVAFWLVIAALLALAFVENASLFVDQAVGGLVYGTILVLVTLGLSIILGLLGVVNFAHGALYMIGAYMTYQFMAVWGLPFWVALLAVPVVIGLLGVAIEMAVLRRIYDENPLIGFLATFGLALMLTEATRATWGGVPLSVRIPGVLARSTDLIVTTVATFRLFSVAVAVIVVGVVYLLIVGTDFGLSVRAGVLDREMAEFLGVDMPVRFVATFRLFSVVVAVVVVGVVYLLIVGTDFGLSVRAGVLDREMAEFLGVNMPVRFVAMFFLGTAIAGLAGVLRGTEVTMNLGMGQTMVILAFVVVVVGGIGSLFGSVVAGLIIGEAVFLTPLVLRTLAEITGIAVLDIPSIGGLMPYLVMIFVLLVRPRGLFGQEGFLE